MQNQKGNIALIIVGIIAVAILAGGVGYFVAKKPAQKEEPEQQAQTKVYDWNVEFILCKKCGEPDVFTEQELLLLKDELLAQLPDEEASFEKLRDTVSNGFFINMTDLALNDFKANMIKENINLSGAKIDFIYPKRIIGQQKTPINENEIYACSEDRECISVADGQCGCGAGGKATTINKQYWDYFKGKISKQEGMCPAVMSNDPTCFMEPKCTQNKCELQKKN